MTPGYILLTTPLLGRIHVKGIVLLFFTDAKIVTDVQSQAAGIALAITKRINATLVKGKVVVIGEEYITSAYRYYQFLFQKLLGEAHIQLAKSA
jgi:hypothetical protein